MKPQSRQVFCVGQNAQFLLFVHELRWKSVHTLMLMEWEWGQFIFWRPPLCRVVPPKSINKALAFRLWICALNDPNRGCNLADHCWQVLPWTCLCGLDSASILSGAKESAEMPLYMVWQKSATYSIFPPNRLHRMGLFARRHRCLGCFWASLPGTPLGRSGGTPSDLCWPQLTGL